MKDRIRQIMEDQHLTQQSFAQMTQISTPTLSNILTGKSRATLNTVELIKRKFPLISLDWLLYGVFPSVGFCCLFVGSFFLAAIFGLSFRFAF